MLNSATTASTYSTRRIEHRGASKLELEAGFVAEHGPVAIFARCILVLFATQRKTRVNRLTVRAELLYRRGVVPRHNKRRANTLLAAILDGRSCRRGASHCIGMVC